MSGQHLIWLAAGIAIGWFVIPMIVGLLQAKNG